MRRRPGRRRAGPGWEGLPSGTPLTGVRCSFMNTLGLDGGWKMEESLLMVNHAPVIPGAARASRRLFLLFTDCKENEHSRTFSEMGRIGTSL